MQQDEPSGTALQCPPIAAESRPWTRWWWMGSAVDEAEITRHLEMFHAAGFGGVEISPIYGVDGEEARAIDFLSPQWVAMLRFTAREAARLGLRVDMITGTGWPLGGPWVAGCSLMPPETLERILDLLDAGGTVLVVGDLPADVPGLAELDGRRQRLQAALARIGPLHALRAGISEARVGQGRLWTGPELEPLLNHAGVRRESMVDTGIELIRRRDDEGLVYFVVSHGPQAIDQWVSLASRAASVAIFGPAGERYGMASVRSGDDPETQVYLQLEPGESLILRTLDRAEDGPAWQYLSPAGQARTLNGDWRVEFDEGGPRLPEPVTIREPADWTALPGDPEDVRAFSGTAHYSTTFELPAGDADAWALDLGRVCHSARVSLDGRMLCTLYARPFRLILPDDLPAGEHLLEIEVTNLMANRLAAMDRQGQAWQKFLFVNTKYEPFSAAGWEPLPSGLLGPVRLVALRRLALAP